MLETSRTRLLVDAGLSKRETLRRLAALGDELERIDGIVISHEHSDHIGGLAALLMKWRATVYLTPATHAEALRVLPEHQARRLEQVADNRAVFEVSHDVKPRGTGRGASPPCRGPRRRSG